MIYRDDREDDQWNDEEEQEVVDDDQEGNDKALLKEITDNAGSSTRTTQPAISSVAFPGDSNRGASTVSGIHGNVRADGGAVNRSGTANKAPESTQESATRNSRKREKPEYEYVSTDTNESTNTSKRVRVDFIVEIRDRLTQFFRSHSGLVEEKKVEKYVKKLKKKFAEKTESTVQEKTENRIREMLNEVSEIKQGRDKKTRYYVLKRQFK